MWENIRENRWGNSRAWKSKHNVNPQWKKGILFILTLKPAVNFPVKLFFFSLGKCLFVLSQTTCLHFNYILLENRWAFCWSNQLAQDWGKTSSYQELCSNHSVEYCKCFPPPQCICLPINFRCQFLTQHVARCLENDDQPNCMRRTALAYWKSP